MKRLLLLFAFLFTLMLLLPSVAFAAKPEHAGKPKPPSEETSQEMVGYDISYPQCGRRLPTDHYFGIVGVNGGLATIINPCLTEQLEWANTAKEGSAQERIQLYVNTANPAEESGYSWASWPTSSVAQNPYGECSGVETNNEACSWQYGWNRSVETEAYFKDKAAEAGLEKQNTDDYIWWLDVETSNSWQSSTDDARRRNTAAIEGFAAYYISKGAQVGLYSTEYQWGEITGNFISDGSNLNGLANWRPSGASLNNAIANCGVEPLTRDGYISLTQYVRKNLDHNHSCLPQS